MSLPRDVLELVELEAERQGRSRSALIAQVLREALDPGYEAPALAPPASRTPVRVREALESAYAEEAAETRAAAGDELAAAAEEEEEKRTREAAAAEQLREGLAMTPSERLARSAELAAVFRAASPEAGRTEVVGFSSFEDFWRWKGSP